MPAKSKKQFDFMRMIAAGKIKKKGLSKEKAKEYLDVVRSSLPKESNKK